MLLAVASAASGTAACTITPTGTLLGSGQLAGTCSITLDTSSTAQGSNLSGPAAITISGTATPIAGNAAAGVCALTFANSATPTSTAGYPTALRQSTVRRWQQPVYDFTHYQNKILIMSLPNEVGIAGQGDITITPTATLRGAGVFLGASANTFGGTGLLLGAGQLAGAAAITITPAADLTSGATGTITGSADAVFGGSATALGAGGISGLSAQSFTPVGSLTGSVDALGQIDISFSIAATLDGIVATPGIVANILIEPTQRGIIIEPTVHGDSSRA